MDRREIIEQFYLSKNFNDCINKMDPPELRDDLREEVIMVICELPYEKLMQMHSRNELQFFAVRTILNMIKSDTSEFYRKYRRTFTHIDTLQMI